MKICLLDREENVKTIQKGGGHTYVDYFRKICKINKWDITDVDNCDIIFLATLGLGKETEEKVIRRVERIIESKKPVYLFLHGVKEQLFYKKTYSLLKDFKFKKIIHPFCMEEAVQKINKFFQFSEKHQVNLPFEGGEFDANREYFSRKIVSPCRIDALKRTTWILEIVERLKKDFEFEIYGKEQGVYWFRGVKEHTFYKKELFKGGYDNFNQIYKGVAFGIDLSLHKDSSWKDPWIDGGKFHYVDLEMMSAGVIPITFDIWKKDLLHDFHSFTVPTPKIKGNSWVVDFDLLSTLISELLLNYGYQRNWAKVNLSIIKSCYSLETVAKKYKMIF